MRAYFWHIFFTLCLLVLVVFVATTLSLRFSDNITFTDENIAPAVPSITVADPQLGNPEARVTLVIYSDYSCPSCASLERILLELKEQHPQDIRLVWKDMPNEARHSEAVPAAIAARCAEKQDAFWTYHALLFENQSSLNNALYLSLAEQIKLDSKDFARCVENQTTLPLVERTLSEGLALQIAATPTLWVNGARYTGSISQTEVTQIINTALAE